MRPADPLGAALEAIAALEPVAGQRLVIAIAGSPAAGKSTLTDRLRAELSPRAGVLGLDAFHFDNAILEARGDLARKGAPHTFDVASYSHLLRLLRAEANTEIAVPVFDRTLELTRNCAELITADHSIVITEGNYLLLDSEPWTGLADLFDLTIWIECELDEIERRILRRWADHGFDDAETHARAERNDLPNARHVIAHSHPAMITVTG